jgi:hypothetical protein
VRLIGNRLYNMPAQLVLAECRSKRVLASRHQKTMLVPRVQDTSELF